MLTALVWTIVWSFLVVVTVVEYVFQGDIDTMSEVFQGDIPLRVCIGISLVFLVAALIATLIWATVTVSDALATNKRLLPERKTPAFADGWDRQPVLPPAAEAETEVKAKE